MWTSDSGVICCGPGNIRKGLWPRGIEARVKIKNLKFKNTKNLKLGVPTVAQWVKNPTSVTWVAV